jgi:hypothetical protein
MTKPRTGIPGHPELRGVVDRSAWGEAKATERYGGGTRTFPPPSDRPQKPQAPEDKHGPAYDNDTSGWVRAPGESAESKPNFDPRGKDGAPKKW